MADDAHDLRRLGAVVELEAPSDRVLAWEVGPGEDVVDDDHARRSLVVGRAEESATPERDAQGLQIAGTDEVVERPAHLVHARRPRPPGRPEPGLVVADERLRTP